MLSPTFEGLLLSIFQIDVKFPRHDESEVVHGGLLGRRRGRLGPLPGGQQGRQGPQSGTKAIKRQK